MKLLSCKWTDTIPQEEKMSMFNLYYFFIVFKYLLLLINIKGYTINFFEIYTFVEHLIEILKILNVL